MCTVHIFCNISFKFSQILCCDHLLEFVLQDDYNNGLIISFGQEIIKLAFEKSTT